MSFSEGDEVKWAWASGTGTGKIAEVYTRKAKRKIKGSEITKNGSKDCPAYYIEQEDGGAVLKLHSEIEKA